MTHEAEDILQRYARHLELVTADGQRKRAGGRKPPWWREDVGVHAAALFRHLARWQRRELVDPDSGGHALVHVAWRALAIACIEQGDVPDREVP